MIVMIIILCRALASHRKWLEALKLPTEFSIMDL